jgi:methionyl-tRNA synthetase
MSEPYYITTAITYPNGAPHIGHAYEYIATDAVARFKRLDGFDVRYLTGTDEHGLKMAETAAAEGIPTAELARRNSEVFQRLQDKLNISYDRFIRTTDADHIEASIDIWKRMNSSGDIYLDSYKGWYSIRDERFFTEAETTVGADGVRIATETGAPVTWTEEETYFFKLSSYADRLLAHYEAHPEFIGPDVRRNEVVSFVSGGLRDLSISRTTFDWGVQVPDHPDHVMYVWVDALTNYITGAGFPDEVAPRWAYWPADIHVIGKDILRFHAVYWPAFLMSAGIALPKRVFAHGFLFNRGEKMSKSVGNVVDPFAMAAHYGVDPMRYFFLREVAFGQDGSYSHEAVVNRINADLANDLGNLAQRSLSMIAKNCGGRLPEPGALTQADRTILEAADALYPKARAAMDQQAIKSFLDAVWAVVADANRYFAAEAPWAQKTTDPARMGTVLHITAEVIRQIAILAQPVMPESSARLLDLLAVPADARDFAGLGEAGRLAQGVALPPPEPIFPRHVDEPAAAETA